MFKYLQAFRTLQAYNNITVYRTDPPLSAYIIPGKENEQSINFLYVSVISITGEVGQASSPMRSRVKHRIITSLGRTTPGIEATTKTAAML